MKIAIIGGGNLGSAIAEGLTQSGFCKPSDITITRRNTAALNALAEKGCIVHRRLTAGHRLSFRTRVRLRHGWP